MKDLINETNPLCECDFPLIRSGLCGGEYCVKCELDLNEELNIQYATLHQAIEKAKPNMDKIKNVDNFLNDIR